MKRRYGIGILALIIAVTAVAFTAMPKNEVKQNEKSNLQVKRSDSPKNEAKPGEKFVDYYYRFTGSAGQEGDTSKWVQISEMEYDNLNCPEGNARACKIVNNTNTSGRPNSVPLSGGLPTVTLPNKEVENRSN